MADEVGVAVAVGSGVGVCDGGMGVFVLVGANGVGVSVGGKGESVTVDRMSSDVSVTLTGELSSAQPVINKTAVVMIMAVIIQRKCIKLSSLK